MKGIICESCGSSRWWTKYVRSKPGLRMRRLKCKQCGRKIFTEEKQKVSQESDTDVTRDKKDSCHNPPTR